MGTSGPTKRRTGGDGVIFEKDYCLVPLRGGSGAGLYAKIDVLDYGEVTRYNWRPMFSRTSKIKVYARREHRENGERVSILMHRSILGLKDGVDGDHINGDGLDNRRANLRVATASQNQWNSIIQARVGVSGYRGVTRAWGTKSRWQSSITYNNRRYYIGSFGTTEEAARAYDEKARLFYGEFARLNFPGDSERAADMYRMSNNERKEAEKLIDRFEGVSIDGINEMMLRNEIKDLELLCRYLETNISGLAAKLRRGGVKVSC